ncbi:hypothetical protein A7D16_20805 [Xanthomonas nasturtii]|nr:hypothetical protein A7D16_20805 [Xanthomonas nasturtii]
MLQPGPQFAGDLAANDVEIAARRGDGDFAVAEDAATSSGFVLDLRAPLDCAVDRLSGVYSPTGQS